MSVPVRISVSAGSMAQSARFVVSLSDAVQPTTYDRLQKAERLFEARSAIWRGIARSIQSNPSDPLPRLELGASIDSFFAGLEQSLDLRVENQIEAVTREIGVRKSALDYIRRASRKFNPAQIRGKRLVWMQLQEMTDIRDPRKAEECLRLVLEGRIVSQEQIRLFKRTANRSARD